MEYRSQRRKNITPLETSCRKEMYNSREDAEDMIRFINENYTGREINAYKCPVCGFWHLTSRKRKDT